MGARRKARECALQMLFQYDIARPKVEDLIKTYWEEMCETAVSESSSEITDFATNLVVGTIAHQEEIDDRISNRAANWRISRMAVVDRNLLRMAVYEFFYEPNTPKTVIINEALEIARRFSTYEATQFINGILDGIKRDLEQNSDQSSVKGAPSGA
ncbi:MAG: transcription antitermination factor NusB [Acidobacteria bacterium]|nr:transcription antitermination factor NusB [Acidobacteriota bacterium]